jgi:hypothetical protein
VELIQRESDRSKGVFGKSADDQQSFFVDVAFHVI